MSQEQFKALVQAIKELAEGQDRIEGKIDKIASDLDEMIRVYDVETELKRVKRRVAETA